MKIVGNTFLVSGGASGLGLATAKHLVELGARVVIADLNASAGNTAAALLGKEARFCLTDVASDTSVSETIQKTIKYFGNLQGVVNCAGILAGSRVLGRDGPHDLQLFARVVQVNLIGTFNVLRLAVAEMSKNEPNDEGERGVVINTASISAFEGQIGQAAYSAAKGGVASMTLPIARELARFGIRVVAIAPGVFNTAMIDSAPEAVQKSLKDQTVFPNRLGNPHEFAAFAEHIIVNPMLNGVVLRLDGALRMAAK